MANADYYHHPSQCRLTDRQYDILYDMLEARYPSSAILEQIGAPVVHATKTKQLPTCMPSMQKLKKETLRLEKWAARYSGPFVVSDKLDGMSLLVHRPATQDQLQAYTRGNGHVGQDVSWIIPHLQLGRTWMHGAR